MTGTLASPGGLEDTRLKGKFVAEEDIPSRVEIESLPRTPENQRVWVKKCIEDMKAELQGVDIEEVKKWRDTRLLQMLEVLASDEGGVMAWGRCAGTTVERAT
jgi:hypothetical protein